MPCLMQLVCVQQDGVHMLNEFADGLSIFDQGSSWQFRMACVRDFELLIAGNPVDPRRTILGLP